MKAKELVAKCPIMQEMCQLNTRRASRKEAQGLKPVIRFRVSRNTEYKFHDMVKGEIVFESDNVGGDFVIQNVTVCRLTTLQ